ncbi:unnamed protein product [Prunus armeniaca]|uniref:MULE transposase domain-containing protein n=1 Tax=Prunus armeniaca TaxID=36596 RepID=A0A6J5XPJ8_PRUAR|nr:unnamed protein product [Prunus armeniaca]CAB4314052.1 unnamed protein product [Prunus armeniaca]
MIKIEAPYFQRLYVCLDAYRKDFLARCRPIIGVYECHLKGIFQGQFLVVVGINANYNIYPIAYVVAKLETKETWCWFLQLLIEDLGLVSVHGLDVAFDLVVPKAAHSWCVRHLYGNFKTLHKGKVLKDLLWNAAKAPNVAEFECEMNKMKELESGEAAHDC